MQGWFNITDFGAVSNTDCTAAIQATVAAAVAVGGGVYIPRGPNGTWQVSQETFIEGPCYIYGEPGATVQAIQPICPFIVGIPRVFSGGHTIDSSYITTSGSMKGWDTQGTSFIEAWSCPATLGAQMTGTSNPTGDYWSQTTQFTLDFIIGPSASGAWTANQFLFGMGTAASQYNSFPWIIWSGNADTNHLEFTFRTADLGGSLNVGDRRWTIPLTGLTAPYQIKIKLDLGAGTFAAYDCSSGSPVSIAGCSFTESPWATIPFASGGMHFWASDQYPLMIGARGQVGPFGGSTTPLALYALRYSAGLTSDCNFWSAAPGPANTIAYIPTITGPPANGRTVHLSTGAAQGASGATAIWFNTAGIAQSGNSTIFDGLTIENMPGQGACVLAGSTLDLRFENCHLYNGANAFLGILESYPVNFANCRIQGFDATISGLQQEIYLRGISCDGGGRTMFRSLGGLMHLEDAFLAAASPGAMSFYCGFNANGTGSRHTIRNVHSDSEGEAQSVAAVYIEQQFEGANIVIIENCDMGLTGTSTPCVVLLRWNGTNTSNWQQGTLRVTGMQGSGYSHAVQILGQSGGTVTLDFPATGAFSTTDEQSTW